MTVEGGGLAYSAGMTNYELAVALVRLGARTAMGLGSGTSAAMAFDGTLLTRATEQPIADALVLSYSGVYVGAARVDDALAERRRRRRRADVLVQARAPVAGDGDRRRARTARRSRSRRTPSSRECTRCSGTATAAVEGSWRFSVTATDDLGRTTTADRQFALNQTLGSLQVTPTSGGATATFQLAHAATVTVTVEKANGIVARDRCSPRSSTPARRA